MKNALRFATLVMLMSAGPAFAENDLERAVGAGGRLAARMKTVAVKDEPVGKRYSKDCVAMVEARVDPKRWLLWRTATAVTPIPWPLGGS